jgi:DNA polymerase family A
MITCQRAVFPDSEFDAKKGQGERPGFPHCICAIEVFPNGHEIEHRLAAPYPERPPWDRGDPYVTIGFALGAEAGSMTHVNWTLPSPAIDLYAEYMVLHNSEMCRGDDGKKPGPSLIQACRRYGVPTMDAAYKDRMRELAYTKANLNEEEIAALQSYCLDDDCRSGLRLFRAMRPNLDLARAPIRGAFTMQLEKMRWRGMPIDVPLYRRAERNAPAIAVKMRRELNRKLSAEIYYSGVFKRAAMFRLMQQRGIPIPIDPKTGKWSCSTRLLKPMIETYPEMKIFYEDKRMLDAFTRLGLEIGTDDRHRTWANPFGTKTGRNNPSTKALWGLPHTMRSFLRVTTPGMAIAQVDVGNEEIGIAAALSGDPTLIADYLSGDPYQQFAAAALGITNPTALQRQVYKACVLGRIYGMGAGTLARNLGISRGQAQHILDQMRTRYPVLNAWLERILIKAAHLIPITCTLGWSLTASGHPGEERTFLNFPMQANGAELMRLVFARAGDLPIIGCAHDSFILEDRADRIEQTVWRMQEIVRAASRDLLGGFELRADCKQEDITLYPNRFIDKREREDGMRHWNWLMRLIEEAENDGREQPGDHGQDAGSPDERLRATAEAGDETDIEAAQTEIRI